MSREIKFRVWDSKDKSMDFYDVYDGCPYHYEKNRKTIMQYTGLKDKNGKEIYEGDIVDIGFGKVRYLAVVLFETICTEYGDVVGFGVCDISEYGGEFEKQFLGKCGMEQITQVVGNIYENPELLQKAERLN